MYVTLPSHSSKKEFPNNHASSFKIRLEVHYPRQGQGKVYYEPEHIHYLPVRREVIDIVEVNITENTEYGEELVKLKDDHTIVTLHFKKATE